MMAFSVCSPTHSVIKGLSNLKCFGWVVCHPSLQEPQKGVSIRTTKQLRLQGMQNRGNWLD